MPSELRRYCAMPPIRSGRHAALRRRGGRRHDAARAAHARACRGATDSAATASPAARAFATATTTTASAAPSARAAGAQRAWVNEPPSVL